MTTATIVSGVFDDYGIVEKVVDELHASGIEDKKIEVFGSEQESALSLKPEVHPNDTVSKLMRVILLGGFIGATFAYTVFLFSPFNTSFPVGALATFAGLSAGMYLGFLGGAIGKLDIAGDDRHFTEEDMTMGRIWVGVKADEMEEASVSQQIMSELGAIRLDPALPNTDERWLGKVATIVGISAVVFMSTIIIISVITSLQVSPSVIGAPVVGDIQRILLFVSFIGLILGSMVTAQAGLSSRGARKWLYFDVEGALRHETEQRNKDPNEKFKKDNSQLRKQGADEALLILKSSEEELLNRKQSDYRYKKTREKLGRAETDSSVKKEPPPQS